MNQNYYQNPLFPSGAIPSQSTEPPIQNMPSIGNQQIPMVTPPISGGGVLPQSPISGGDISPQPPYAENILKKNQGKMATFYMSYADSIRWRDREFTGIIEDSGRDYALISDPKTGKWWLLWTVYLNYVEFEEPITHF